MRRTATDANLTVDPPAWTAEATGWGSLEGVLPGPTGGGEPLLPSWPCLAVADPPLWHAEASCPFGCGRDVRPGASSSHSFSRSHQGSSGRAGQSRGLASTLAAGLDEALSLAFKRVASEFLSWCSG